MPKRCDVGHKSDGMQHAAHFSFRGSLTQFPCLRKKPGLLTYPFHGTPSIKDTIEALGVPHVEVFVIVVNERPRGFDYHLQDGDRVTVYPKDLSNIFSPEDRLNAVDLKLQHFIADVQLGRLCSILRLLGFDCLYQNDFTVKDIIFFALTEERIVLTRNVNLLKNNKIHYGYWLRSEQHIQQAREVISYFDLAHRGVPFSRCLTCNGSIHPVRKDAVLHKIPPGVRAEFDEFFECSQCGKVYWKGSHYAKMEKTIASLETK